VILNVVIMSLMTMVLASKELADGTVPEFGRERGQAGEDSIFT
jgi:hypothetical protein